MRLNLSQRGGYSKTPPGGYKVSQGGVQDLDAVRVSDMAPNGGTLPNLDQNGLVPLEYIRSQNVNYQVQLEGPTFGYQHAILKYKITNYGFDRTLQATTAHGEISIVRDEVTFIPREFGDVKFSINQRDFTVQVVPAKVVQPTILLMGLNSQPAATLLSVSVSDFNTENITDTQKLLTIEVYGDYALTDLITKTDLPGVGINSTTITLTRKLSVYFVRARYQGEKLGYSLWSNPGQANLTTDHAGAAPNARYGESIAISANAERIVVGSPNINNGAGSVSVLRVVSTEPRRYSEEMSFLPINQPTSIALVVPPGGSIQVMLDSAPPYNEVFTANATVNLPAWKSSGKLIGKGAPGSQTWIEGTPSTPAKGSPDYPNGLPKYVAPSGPIYEVQKVAVTIPAVYNQAWVYQGTFNQAPSSYSATQGTNGVIRNDPANIDPNSVVYGYLGRVVTRIYVGDEYVAGRGYEYVDREEAWVVERTTMISDAYIVYEDRNVLVGYSSPGAGVSTYPNGLPPYAPEVPGTPGHYESQQGQKSTAVIHGVTYSFDGGSGTLPAVTTTKTLSANDSDSFGKSVFITSDANKIVVGAPKDQYNDQTEAGGVFVSSLINGVWSDFKNLTSRALFEKHNLGASVCGNEDGSRIFAGAPGGGYVAVFINDTHSTNLSFSAASSASAEFGCWVRCSNDGKTLAVGAPGLTINGQKGAIIVFKETNGSWDGGRAIQPVINPVFKPKKIAGDAGEYELRVGWKRSRASLGSDGVMIVPENQSVTYPADAAEYGHISIQPKGTGVNGISLPNPPLNNSAYLLEGDSYYDTLAWLTALWPVGVDFTYAYHRNIFRKAEGFGYRFALSGDGNALEAGCYDAGPSTTLLSENQSQKAVVFCFDLTTFVTGDVKGLTVDTAASQEAFRASGRRSMNFHPVLQRRDFTNGARSGSIALASSSNDIQFLTANAQVTITDGNKGNDFAWAIAGSDTQPDGKNVWVVSDPSHNNSTGKIWVNG